jgi:hypothetical protein
MIGMDQYELIRTVCDWHSALQSPWKAITSVLHVTVQFNPVLSTMLLTLARSSQSLLEA